MIFSHISDTHLGLQQYGLEEREQDIYDSFNQAIDISIKDEVDFVIFAGDIFHTPNPNGKAILQICLLYTSPSPRDLSTSRMPSSA